MNIDSLVESVMSHNQAKVYYSLLQNNNSTASELQRFSGIALNQTNLILKFLYENGFCFLKISSGKIRYSLIDPGLAFKDEIKNRKELLVKKENLRNSLKSSYDSRALD